MPGHNYKTKNSATRKLVTLIRNKQVFEEQKSDNGRTEPSISQAVKNLVEVSKDDQPLIYGKNHRLDTKRKDEQFNLITMCIITGQSGLAEYLISKTDEDTIVEPYSGRSKITIKQLYQKILNYSDDNLPSLRKLISSIVNFVPTEWRKGKLFALFLHNTLAQGTLSRSEKCRMYRFIFKRLANYATNADFTLTAHSSLLKSILDPFMERSAFSVDEANIISAIKKDNVPELKKTLDTLTEDRRIFINDRFANWYSTDFFLIALFNRSYQTFAVLFKYFLPSKFTIFRIFTMIPSAGGDETFEKIARQQVIKKHNAVLTPSFLKKILYFVVIELYSEGNFFKSTTTFLHNIKKLHGTEGQTVPQGREPSLFSEMALLISSILHSSSRLLKILCQYNKDSLVRKTIYLLDKLFTLWIKNTYADDLLFLFFIDELVKEERINSFNNDEFMRSVYITAVKNFIFLACHERDNVGGILGLNQHKEYASDKKNDDQGFDFFKIDDIVNTLAGFLMDSKARITQNDNGDSEDIKNKKARIKAFINNSEIEQIPRDQIYQNFQSIEEHTKQKGTQIWTDLSSQYNFTFSSSSSIAASSTAQGQPESMDTEDEASSSSSIAASVASTNMPLSAIPTSGHLPGGQTYDLSGYQTLTGSSSSNSSNLRLPDQNQMNFSSSSSSSSSSNRKKRSRSPSPPSSPARKRPRDNPSSSLPAAEQQYQLSADGMQHQAELGIPSSKQETIMDVRADSIEDSVANPFSHLPMPEAGEDPFAFLDDLPVSSISFAPQDNNEEQDEEGDTHMQEI